MLPTQAMIGQNLLWTLIGVFLQLIDGAVMSDNKNGKTGANMEDNILHRRKRDLTWNDIETFYEDKNNFAMYLVLPIIVIVYGGCAVIYCIARCRRYVKKSKRKAHLKDETIENEPLDSVGAGNPQRHTSIPSISTIPNSRQDDGGLTSRDGARTSSEVQIAMDHHHNGEADLPWQVPGDRQPLVAAAAVRVPNKSYENKGYEAEYDMRNQHPSSRPPPSYEDTYQKRPLSKPPPYEERGNRERRQSVEEIITLDPMPTNDYNDRKRRRPGSRPGSQQSLDPRKETQRFDEEREKARQLVRGDRPKRETEKASRERTPDIISHARTQPLEPRYKPTQPDAQSDATLMAKQAAQLLRLDHMGKQQGKKQKRLVFVAE